MKKGLGIRLIKVGLVVSIFALGGIALLWQIEAKKERDRDAHQQIELRHVPQVDALGMAISLLQG